VSRLSEDLRDRTKRFAFDVIQLYVTLPKGRKEVEILGNQLLRSGTSVAAHAREASRARSDSEFCSKLDGLLQEADESQLWLELLRDDCAIQNVKIRHLLAKRTSFSGSLQHWWRKSGASNFRFLISACQRL
jgi:four helix bundle protein